MAQNSSTPYQQPEPAVPIGSGARTAVTLLLIAHLFAITIGVLSSARPLSPLRNKLADVPFIRPYLQLLYMDTAYNFHLTDGLEDDLDHFVLIEQQGAAESQSEDDAFAIRLPQRGMQPPIRRERLQQFAQRAAAGVEGDPVRPLVAKAIGGALLRRAEAPDGTYRLRVRRHDVVARDNVDSPRTDLSDPYDSSRYTTAYEGAIILSGSDVYFSEIAPEEQRAGLRDDPADGNDQP